MSGLDAEIKLYVKEQIESGVDRVSKKAHKLSNDLTSLQFEIKEQLEDERNKNDKKYSPAIVGKIVFTLVGLIVSGVFGALLKLVIIG